MLITSFYRLDKMQSLGHPCPSDELSFLCEVRHAHHMTIQIRIFHFASYVDHVCLLDPLAVSNRMLVVSKL